MLSGAKCCFKNALPCTPLPPLCKCYKGVSDNQTRDRWAWLWGWWWWQWLTVHIITVFVPCWAVWNQTIMPAACWLYCGFINMKEKVAIYFFKQSWLCVYMLLAAALSYMIKVWQMTMCQLKILFQFLLMFNEWFSFWLESVEFLHNRHSSSVLLPDSGDWYKYLIWYWKCST